MRNRGRSNDRQLFGPRPRITRTLAGVLLIAGLITAWTLTTPAKAGASGGISGSSMLTAVSCTSMSACIALGAGGQGWSYNGTVWSPATPVDTSGTLSAVSCASPSFCVAVDYTGQAITFDGTTWSAPTLVDSSGLLSSVSCASRFVLRGRRLRGPMPSRSTGRRGQLQRSSTPRVYSVRSRAPAASFCVAVDYAGQAITFNGTTLVIPAIDGPVRPPLLFGLLLVRRLLCRRELIRR